MLKQQKRYTLFCMETEKNLRTYEAIYKFKRIALSVQKFDLRIAGSGILEIYLLKILSTDSFILFLCDTTEFLVKLSNLFK